MKKDEFPQVELKNKNRFEYYSRKFNAQSQQLKKAEPTQAKKKKADLFLQAAQIFEAMHKEMLNDE